MNILSLRNSTVVMKMLAPPSRPRVTLISLLLHDTQLQARHRLWN